MTKEIAVIAPVQHLAIKLELPAHLKSYRGNVVHYKLSPAYDAGDKMVEYIVVSGVNYYSGFFGVHECLAFPADESGFHGWCEVAGFRDTVSHSEVLTSMGYDILDSAPPVPVVVITEKNRQDVHGFIEGEFEIIHAIKLLKADNNEPE